MRKAAASRAATGANPPAEKRTAALTRKRAASLSASPIASAGMSSAPPAPDTRTRMLQAAVTLLRSGGLNAAGMNSVIAASGAPKGSMYHHFPGGKDQLLGEALALFAESFERGISKLLSMPGTPGERIALLFAGSADRLAASDYSQSCPVGAVSLDLAPGTSALQTQVADTLAHWQGLAETLMDGLPADERARLSRLTVTLLEGGLLMARGTRSTTALLEAGDLMKRLVDSAVADAMHANPSKIH
jgi:TetR/AcrR family transcriptional regulator, lmrAB and yxaGH operons repressor